MHFEFSTAERILFGPGQVNQVGKLAAEIGNRALVATGAGDERVQPVLDLLSEQGITANRFRVSGEPTVDIVQLGVDLARRADCSLVIAHGGGSALDAGKAIAILATNPGEVTDYLEVIGRGRSLSNPPLPFITIPTTAGTGAEVTRNAVIGSPEQHVKVSIRSGMMRPYAAIVDPELTYSMPPDVTASTGLDALTQLIEPFVSRQANPVTDALCQEGLVRAARSLRSAYQHGDDAAARLDMSLASLLSGMALANSKLGAVHGFASVLGGELQAPHGVICARLLPHVMEINVSALQARSPGSDALRRYDTVAKILTGDFEAGAQEGVAWVQKICEDMQVPPLRKFGLNRDRFPELIEKSARASSTKGNPVELNPDEMAAILARAM